MWSSGWEVFKGSALPGQQTVAPTQLEQDMSRAASLPHGCVGHGSTEVQSILQPRPCCSSPRAGGGCRTSWEHALGPPLSSPSHGAFGWAGWSGLVLPPAMAGQMPEAEAVFYNHHLWLLVGANPWLSTSVFTWPLAAVCQCLEW